MKIPDSIIERLLEEHPVARLASLGKDGTPHQVPVVFARHADLLWSPVDGKAKSGKELVRIRNIRNDPRVSLLLDAYEEDWSKLWWIRISGTARIVESGTAQAEYLPAVVKALGNKYPQYEEISVLREPETLVAITPGRINSWSAIELE